jgi:N-acetylneuraminic acid mutarotase
MVFMFKKRLSLSHLRTISGKLVVVGLLMAAMLLTGVLASGGSLHAQAAPARPMAAAGSWTSTGSLQTARSDHTATLLSNGRVLVAGGSTHGGPGGALASAELYNPATGTWTATGSMQAARWEYTATLLPTGRVLVVGGRDNGVTAQSSAELYDPATGTWTATSSMQTARFFHTATLLPNGRVLVAGGWNDQAPAVIELSAFMPSWGCL